LVKAAERGALVKLERLANVMDAGPASTGIFYNYDRTALHVVSFKKVLPTLYSGPT